MRWKSNSKSERRSNRKSERKATKKIRQGGVGLVLEGTYPYVPGGVSSWVHQLLHASPERSFTLVHISPHKGFFKERAFEVPDNVHQLDEVYLSGKMPSTTLRRRRGWFRRQSKGGSRVLRALRRIHLENTVDDELISDLCAGDLSLAEFLHGDESFEMLRTEIYPTLGRDTSFTDFFWHYRALHSPMLRLLNRRYPKLGCYHAVSAGYAGLVGVVASKQHDRPFFLTEHGIYAREREIELARARWISDAQPALASAAQPSPLRHFWAHYFKMLSRIAYEHANQVVTLSETNRQRQLQDGARADKTSVVPNGVDRALYEETFQEGRATRAKSLAERVASQAEGAEDEGEVTRIGFVGRVVPIKDVVTLLKAFAIAQKKAKLELWIIGPQDEDEEYADRCKLLAAKLGISESAKFLGRQPMREMYPKLDALVLTSISEGQPLVILEAYANRVPVISTDVGACRELIEGADEVDRAIGPAGIVTRVANPIETASAMVYMANNVEERLEMGEAGYRRVASRYQQQQVITKYDSLYNFMVSSSQV